MKSKGSKLKMCEICRKYLCPPGCPSFVGRSAEFGRRLFRCAGCGANIYEDDDYVLDYGKPYCLECMNLDDDEE